MAPKLDISLPTAALLFSKANLHSSPSVDGKIEKNKPYHDPLFCANKRAYVKGRLVRLHQKFVIQWPIKKMFKICFISYDHLTS